LRERVTALTCYCLLLLHCASDFPCSCSHEFWFSRDPFPKDQRWDRRWVHLHNTTSSRRWVPIL
jgi:hypothetical protein